MNQTPSTIVIVVGTNEKKWLMNCFQSICESDFPNLQILYIDNASKDNSIEFVRNNFPKIKIIQNNENFGFAKANNIGMQYALDQNFKYIFLLNPDTITPSCLITELVTFLEINRNYGVIGPLQMEYNNPNALNTWSIQALKNKERPALYKWDSQRPIINVKGKRATMTLEHAYVQGAAFFIRAEILNQIGLFNEVYHTYYEEVDLCRRARWKGFKVALLLNTSIQHYEGGGTENNSQYRNFYYSRNKYIYLISDAEYTFSQIVAIIIKWLKKDFKESCSSNRRDIKNLMQLILIIISLTRNFTKILNARKKNLLLYRSLMETEP